MENDQGLKLQKKAKEIIAGSTASFSRRPELFTEGIWPGYFKKAKGAEVWDLDNNHFIDMSHSGHGQNILGYADPDVNAAVQAVVESGNLASLSAPEEVELAEFFMELHPWAGECMFMKTLGEALSVAIRLARSATSRDKICVCGDHGWHDWHLAQGFEDEESLSRATFEGAKPGGVPQALSKTCFSFGYGRIEHLNQIEEENKGEIAAIVFEPDMGRRVRPDFIPELKKCAESMGAVLIFNESKSAFRMSSGGAHLHMGITPDIAVYSDSIANGYPFSALVGTKEIMRSLQNTWVSENGWSERIGFAAALACMKKCKDKDVAFHLLQIGKRVQDGLRHLADLADLKIRIQGIPPLTRFDFRDEKAPLMNAFFIQKMLAYGFLASNRFYAMYAHTDDHVKSYLRSVEVVFQSLAKALKDGDLEQKIKGKPTAMKMEDLD